MNQLFDIPAATTTITAMAQYTVPWFQVFLPIVYFSVGILAAVLIILWLKEKLINAFVYMFGGGNGPTDSLGNPDDINLHYKNK